MAPRKREESAVSAASSSRGSNNGRVSGTSNNTSSGTAAPPSAASNNNSGGSVQPIISSSNATPSTTPVKKPTKIAPPAMPPKTAVQPSVSSSSLASDASATTASTSASTAVPETPVVQSNPTEPTTKPPQEMKYSELFRASKDSVNFMKYVWLFLLAIVASCDILATVLPYYVLKKGEEETVPDGDGFAVPAETTMGYIADEVSAAAKSFTVYAFGEDSYVESSFIQFVKFLDEYDVTIGFFFSFLWFLDAFVSAQQRRTEAQRQRERRRLQVQNEAEKQMHAQQQMHPPQKRRRSSIIEIATTDPLKRQTENHWYNRPWVVYYSTIAVQLLLLPVGFYFLMYHNVDSIVHGEQLELPDDVDDELLISKDFQQEQQASSDIYSYFDYFYAREDEYVHFNAESKITLGFALLKFFWLRFKHVVTRIAQTKVVTWIKSTALKFVRQTLAGAVRNPIKFRKRVKKALNILRWVKYLGPIVPQLNKLRENFSDYLKKRRQHRQAVIMRKIKRRLFREKTGELLRKDAANIIQSSYRAYKSRQAYKALKLIQGQKEYFATLKMQRVLRKKLAQARERLRLKAEELKKLKQKQRLGKDDLSDDEKKRIFELQDELGAEAQKLINRKLLMRPNTRFAVIWKILFVTCVIIEITQLAIKPMLEKHQQKVTIVDTETNTTKRVKEAMKVDDWLASKVVPTPIETWKECKVKKKTTLLSRIVKKLKRKKEQVKPLPWYCNAPYPSVQDIYIEILKFVIYNTLTIVGIICYMDVFISFFTGEFDPNNGNLVPKPFVKRWIIPGILIQLLLNPVMGPTAEFVGKVINMAIDQGPIRVWRWCVAAIFPICYILGTSFIGYVWLPLVAFSNKRTVG